MSNPLLDELDNSGVVKTVEIALPTLARFYPLGEVLDSSADATAMRIQPLSILEESAFTDPMMLLSGRGVSRMIKRVAPMVTEPEKLSDIDVQAILIACRIVSHGPDIEVDQSCPSCEKESKLKIDLEDFMMKFTPFTDEESDQFTIVLPEVGQTVRLKPISYKDATEIVMMSVSSEMGMKKYADIKDDEIFDTAFIQDYKAQFEKMVDNNVTALASSIYYVQTRSEKKIFNREHIKEWLVALPTDEVKVINRRLKVIGKFIQERTKMKFTCPSCKKSNDVHVNLDPQMLFTQAAEQEVEKKSAAESKITKSRKSNPERILQK